MKEAYVLSKNLKDLRKQYGYTQKQVAEKLSITYQSYQAYELGLTLPTYINFIKLADLYDVSLDYLIGRSSERKYNTLGMDALVFDIIEQVNRFSTTEKEILLQHLKLANELKSGIAT